LLPALCACEVGFHARCCSCKADHATSSPHWPSHRRPTALTPLEAHATAAVRDGVRLAQCESIAQLRAAILGRLRILRPRNGERATLWVDKHRVLQAQGGVEPIAKTAITRRCAVWGCFGGPWVRYTPGGQNRLPQRSHWSARWRASRWAVKVT
jgi:hypothetical protein